MTIGASDNATSERGAASNPALEAAPGPSNGPARSRSGRVVLITGASAGIGAAVALEIARRGQARALVLTARRLDRLDRLAEALRAAAPGTDLETLTIAADLADPEAPERLAAIVADRFGGIDVLINNAGLGLPTQFLDAERSDVLRQIAVNLSAPLLMVKAFSPGLIARRGMIVNIGSAITCLPNSALGAYGATKAGLAYWNDALRRELAPLGVRVCLVEPGPVHTEFMEALGSLLPPGERADPILDNAAPWMSITVSEAAAPIARLLDRPRRRLSVPRRFVWPFRLIGSLLRACPPLGDWIVVRLSRRPWSQTSIKARSASE